MLTETLASTIIEASITGAGLIIAIYALMTPVSRKIFKERVERMRKKKKQFDRLMDKISSESSLQDIDELKTLSKEIKGTKAFPKYLSIGVVGDFLLFISAAFFAFTWLIEPNITREFIVIFSFVGAVVGFFVVGGSSILDVYLTMKEEFEQLKKEKEEVEKDRKEIERFEKLIGV